MGPLPGDDRKVPLDVKTLSEEKLDGYVRKKISFAAEKGELVHPARQVSRRIGKRRPMERVLRDVRGDDDVPPPMEEPTATTSSRAS